MTTPPNWSSGSGVAGWAVADAKTAGRKLSLRPAVPFSPGGDYICGG